MSQNAPIDAIDPNTLAAPAVRLRVQTALRWMAIAGQAAAVAIVYLGFGFDLPAVATLIVIGLAVALNIALLVLFPANHMLTQRQTALFLAYDMVQLGLLLFLTGGLLNPFSLLLLAPVRNNKRPNCTIS